MRPSKLAHQGPDRLAHRGGDEVDLTGLGYRRTIAGFALSTNCRFSGVHRGLLPEAIHLLAERAGCPLRKLIAPLQCERIEIGANCVRKKPFHMSPLASV